MSLDELVQEVLELVTVRSNACAHIAPGLNVVCGDRIRILEVYQNLLRHANEFVCDQPEPLIYVGARHAREKVVVWVRNYGIGIEQKYKERDYGLSG